MKQSNNVYIYDNSFEGLLTVIYKCLKLKEIPFKINSELTYEDNLLEQPIFISTELNCSKIILNKIINISNYTLYLIKNAFLNNNKTKEIIIYKYFLCCLKYGSKFNYYAQDQNLINIIDLSKQVKKETHHFKGFLRFKELKANVLYSKIEPENNILEKLAVHFKYRLKNDNFIIHDTTRNIVAVYNQKDIYYGSGEELDLEKLKTMEQTDEYETYWKSYFKNIAIPERKNYKCQITMMPKKYWKNMLEMESEL